MAERAQYLLPEDTAPATAAERLAERLGATAEPARTSTRTYYDTFDGRLHAAGLALVHADGELRLGDLAAQARPSAPERLLLADLDPGPLRDALAGHIEMRALLPAARVRSRERVLRVLDDERKTVVRLRVELPALAGNGRAGLRPRVHVLGVRGYDGALRRVRRALEDDLGLTPAMATLYDEAVVASGGDPAGVSSKPAVQLTPGEPAGQAVAAVLRALQVVIDANLPGTLADLDTEFLHDFRVAVRRTRSVQREFQGVFPPARLQRARRDFRRLQQITGAVRDLDVNLLEFDELAGPLVGELEPLRRLLAERREAEFRKMVRALRSAATRSALERWSELIGELDGEDAQRPVEELSSLRIARVYRRMVKMGRAIDDSSPAEDLHEMRKKGKELRYLLELFGGLYPAEATRPLVKALKALQDTLGRHQDREVQAAQLRALRDDLARVAGGPAALMAVGLLVERLGADEAAARAEFGERFAAFAGRDTRKRVKAVFG
jgi:CHAD domain-containing protein